MVCVAYNTLMFIIPCSLNFHNMGIADIPYSFEQGCELHQTLARYNQYSQFAWRADFEVVGGCR